MFPKMFEFKTDIHNNFCLCAFRKMGNKSTSKSLENASHRKQIQLPYFSMKFSKNIFLGLYLNQNLRTGPVFLLKSNRKFPTKVIQKTVKLRKITQKYIESEGPRLVKLVFCRLDNVRFSYHVVTIWDILYLFQNSYQIASEKISCYKIKIYQPLMFV